MAPFKDNTTLCPNQNATGYEAESSRPLAPGPCSQARLAHPSQPPVSLHSLGSLPLLYQPERPDYPGCESRTCAVAQPLRSPTSRSPASAGTPVSLPNAHLQVRPPRPLRQPGSAQSPGVPGAAARSLAGHLLPAVRTPLCWERPPAPNAPSVSRREASPYGEALVPGRGAGPAGEPLPREESPAPERGRRQAPSLSPGAGSSPGPESPAPERGRRQARSAALTPRPERGAP
ncbi:nematocyst expressed protein 3-like [Mustela nigripes]|uniref:nematocyst expressed protein 3-like n=1 Tax=Mustela nigripes TaxID=77151 RepID=UPI002815BBB1|nr:nematocyst expressed protein 3-like [Mustela nigripes]